MTALAILAIWFGGVIVMGILVFYTAPTDRYGPPKPERRGRFHDYL